MKSERNGSSLAAAAGGAKNASHLDVDAKNFPLPDGLVDVGHIVARVE